MSFLDLYISFLDLFKPRKTREQLSHLANLDAVATADGKMKKNEWYALTSVMTREGLTNPDLYRCIKNPKSVKFLPPETPEQKCRMKDMFLLMMCDGDIDDRELALCKATAIALGFKHGVIDAMIRDIIADIKRNL